MNRVLAAAITGVIVGDAGTFAILAHDQADLGTHDQKLVRELEDVPKMTDAVAALHREDRYENLHSVCRPACKNDTV